MNDQFDTCPVCDGYMTKDTYEATASPHTLAVEAENERLREMLTTLKEAAVGVVDATSPSPNSLNIFLVNRGRVSRLENAVQQATALLEIGENE